MSTYKRKTDRRFVRADADASKATHADPMDVLFSMPAQRNPRSPYAKNLARCYSLLKDAAKEIRIILDASIGGSTFCDESAMHMVYASSYVRQAARIVYEEECHAANLAFRTVQEWLDVAHASMTTLWRRCTVSTADMVALRDRIPNVERDWAATER